MCQSPRRRVVEEKVEVYASRFTRVGNKHEIKSHQGNVRVDGEGNPRKRSRGKRRFLARSKYLVSKKMRRSTFINLDEKNRDGTCLINKQK